MTDDGTYGTYETYGITRKGMVGKVMAKVRVGVIGCGVIGKVHARMVAESAQAELAAVADVREDMAQQAAKEFGAARAYGAAEALLDDRNVDAVIVALPTNLRTPIALKSLAMRKHTLIEKPIAMNEADVRRIIAARGDLVAGCCSARLSLMPSSLAAAKFISSGALDALRVVRIRAIIPAGKKPEKDPPPWRLNRSLNGGGILMNWGCYDLDFALSLTGWKLQPRTVFAQTWGVAPHLTSYVAPGSNAESHFAALITCDAGVAITFERGEYVAAPSDMAWQVIGAAGSVRMQMTPKAAKEVYYDFIAPEGIQTKVLWSGDEEGIMQHRFVVEDFVAAVRERRAPHTSLERALLVQQISDAIYQSAASGKAVNLA